MQERISTPVAGPSAIFPRGFLWQVPVWYAAAALLLAYARQLPGWFRLAAAAGLLGAVITLLATLAALRVRAFAADADGVRLGLPASTRRRGRRRREARHLPWQHIERVRIAQRRGGVRLEFVVSPTAPVMTRGFAHGPLSRARRWLLLLIPFWYLLRPTALVTPLHGPSPTYRLTVRGVTLDEVRQALRSLAPREVPVAVLVRRG